MRVLVVGAGVIGAIYGWALAGAGHEVAHLVRPGRAAGLVAGLRMDVLDCRKPRRRRVRETYPLRAIEQLTPAGGFETVIVPVKHDRLDAALAAVAPAAGAADFVLLTQNWRGAAVADAVLPRERQVWADARAGGAFAGGVLVAALRSIDLGPAEGPPTEAARRAAALFASAGIGCGLHADMLAYLWVQYAVTGAMWAALIDAGGMAAILGDRRRVSRMMQAGRECLAVLTARGLDVAAYPETRPFLDRNPLRRALAMWAVGLMFRYDAYTKRCSAHAFGDPAEVALFYDDLTGTGRTLGVPMPAMDSYAAAVRRFEGAR